MSTLRSLIVSASMGLLISAALAGLAGCGIHPEDASETSDGSSASVGPDVSLDGNGRAFLVWRTSRVLVAWQDSTPSGLSTPAARAIGSITSSSPERTSAGSRARIRSSFGMPDRPRRAALTTTSSKAR